MADVGQHVPLVRHVDAHDPLVNRPEEHDPLVQRVDALLRRHQQRVDVVHAMPSPATAPTPASADIPAAAVADAPIATGEQTLTQPQDASAVQRIVSELPDEDFPVLTEIVDPDALTSGAAPTEDLRGDALVIQIETAVMDKLLVELDRALDQRLGRTLTDLLEQVLHGMRAELSVSVRRMVREAVAAATAKEIAERLRSE